MKKSAIISAIIASVATAVNAQTVVDQDITGDTTWNTAGSPYVLENEIFVKEGAVLTIQPGVVVRGQPANNTSNPGSLIVTRNGRIMASGDRTNPIIFTTATVDTNGDDIPDDDGEGNAARFDPNVHDLSDFYDTDPKNDPLPPLAGGATPGDQNVTVPGGSGQGLSANTELWGGLLILGNAPTNLGTSAGGSTDIGKEEALEGFIEGLENTEDTAYGGLFANDDSGVLEFVSVRHGGEVIGEANEINGITLAGVGFGTKIENCEVYMTWDDGFEWFGGTVNARNLMVTYAGDDQFDGDQGWIGQVQNAFAVFPYFAMGSGSGDTLFEFDGEDGSGAPDSNVTADGDVFPYPSYAFANFTGVGPLGASGNAIGSGTSGSIEMKAGFSGSLFNGFIVNTGATPFNYNSPEPIVIDTVTLKNVGSESAVPPNATVVNIVDQGVSGAGLVGEDQAALGGLNPRPNASGFPPPAGTSSNLSLPQPFESTSYVGAFNPSANLNLWTTGWTVLNIQGILVD